jgi:5-methylcytosine-specific restriction endonuclease McrBC regulatory subunit McrC
LDGFSRIFIIRAYPRHPRNPCSIVLIIEQNSDFLIFPGIWNCCIVFQPQYKILYDEDRKAGISQQDMYQAAVYAQVYKCPNIVLIYPQSADMKKPIRKSYTLNGGINVAVSIGTVNLNLQFPKDFGKLAKEVKNHYEQ